MDAQRRHGHRKQHAPSSSMGSLYEVLADLDETQLHYLIQEMNHTGHQNVPVSQAVKAFESQDPSASLNSVRASTVPPVQGLQRQLSKSQRGKLRLQTAFQRAPSLRQARRSESHSETQPVRHHQATHGEVPIAAEVHEGHSALVGVAVGSEPHGPGIEPQMYKSGIFDASISQTPAASGQGQSPAYRRIPRPDFDLPPGVTVIDLLQLLKSEYLSSNSQGSAFDDAASPSSASSSHFSPSPLLLSPLSRTPLRRHSSRLDMALEADKTASGVEEIGLGMLEPRPSTSTTSRGISPAAAGDSKIQDASISQWSGNGDSSTLPLSALPPPLVLEGIFDVLENQ